MSLSATTQGFLREVESSTGLKVLVEEDPRLQPPLLAKVHVARNGVPFHRVVYHPTAHGMADYLVAYQCSFILRLHGLPPGDRFDLADHPVAQEECLAWTRSHPASAHLAPDRQDAFASFLRTSLVSMVRSVPVGLWVDQDLRARFPELREAQEQAIRRQLDVHARVLGPEVQKSVPVPAFRANAAINAAFAKAWSRAFNEPGGCLPYVVAGAAQAGDDLLGIMDNLLPLPLNDRRIVQAWADHLGIGHWLRWIPHVP